MRLRFSFPPASYFGMALGVLALGLLWRAAGGLWTLPPVVSTILLGIGAALWAVLILAYLAKWIWARPLAVAELGDPVQSGFIALATVITFLAAQAILPYQRDVAVALTFVGAAVALAFAAYVSGRTWRGERNEADTTTALYLPTVGAGFVGGGTLGLLGWPEWGRLALGAGFFSWIAIESVLMRRFFHPPALPPKLRPTLGIQLAPPVVCCVAYLNLGGHDDVFAHLLVGYGLLQALILIRMLPWIAAQPFGPGYWAFSFGVAALPTAVVKLAILGDGAMRALAPTLFAAANLIIIGLMVGTAAWMLRGQVKAVAPVTSPASGRSSP